MMSKFFWIFLVSLAVIVPLIVFSFAQAAWALGLGLGESLGLLAFFWIRWSVQKALTPQAKRSNPYSLLLHSMLRLGILGLIFFFVVKKANISIWAVLLGYTLVQLPTAVWQRSSTGERKVKANI